MRIVYKRVMNIGKFSFLRKNLSLQTSCFCTPLRRCSDAPKRIPNFDEMILQRRAEAQRSLVVQVSSKASFQELSSYCSSYADIKDMHHYNNTNGEHFMLIEFTTEENLKKVLQECSSHQRVIDVMAVSSPFVWFRALPGRPRTPPTSSNQELTSTDANCQLDDDQLHQKLMECATVSDQIQTLYDSTVLNDVGVRLRYMVARQLEVILSSLYANVAVQPFGSSINGFGRMGCDLDLVLSNIVTDSMSEASKRLVFQEKKCEGGRSPWQRHMELISEVLELRVPGAGRVQRILHARVPIVKFNHEFTDVQCDLGYNNLSGLHMSELLWLYGTLDPRVRPLTFVIRRWARSVGITSPHPGRWITNFPLTLMVLFFLQQRTRDGVVLPTLNYLIRNSGPEDQRIAEDNINCTFLRDLNRLPASVDSHNTSNLDQLLLQFFEFYAQYDFSEKAISIREGQAIRKPNNLPLYIVNPLEPTLNVSRNVSFEELEKIRSEIRNAAWTLESVAPGQKTEDWGIIPLIERRQSRELKKLLRVGNSHRLVSVKDLFTEDETANSNSSKNKIENQPRRSAHDISVDHKQTDKNSKIKFKNTSVANAVYRIRRSKFI